MKDELISVIVPVHNGQAYLENCIDSIAGQTWRNLEILVVNDGSTDQTAAVCEHLQAVHKNLQVFTLADVGVSAARNYALDRARGAYITFVDADDRLRPDMLRRLYERINATHSDLAGCRFAAWSTESEWEALLALGDREEPAGSGEDSAEDKGNLLEEELCYDSYRYLTESILQDNCRCWSKLYRRRAVEQVRFREGFSVGEDMLFLVDILPHVERAVELSYKGYGYYQNPGGVMRRPFHPSYMDQVKSWELAQEAILRIDEGLRNQTAAKVMTAIMLTVGKIALCPAKERREAGRYLTVCREKLKEQMEAEGSHAFLPPGYGLKVKLFGRLPGLYVRLYHILQVLKHRGRGGR